MERMHASSSSRACQKFRVWFGGRKWKERNAATRNVSDFGTLGIGVVNPYDS